MKEAEGGVTLTEAWAMPVELRHWWLKKDQEEREKEGKKRKHTDPFGREHEG